MSRDARYREKLAQLEQPVPRESDDRLRLMFTCCHPALSRAAQDLEHYHLFHAIRGELLREQAWASALRALELTQNRAEQSLLARRLLEW